VSIPGRAPQSSFTEHFPRRLGTVALGVLLGLLLFALGCSSNGSSVPGPHSNASLNGTYVLQMSGHDSFLDTSSNEQDEAYTETIVLKADGSGHLTGVEDFNSSRFGFTGGTAFTGSYSVAHDGNGSITIDFSAPSSGQINLSITLASTTKFYAAEADAFVNFSANATGVAVLQNSSAIAAAPTGTFVTRVHQVNPTTVSSATVGALTSAGTTVTGTIDVLRNDALLPQLSLTAGSFAAPDTNGRGTLTYTDSSNATTNYEYYIVDANTFWLMGTDNTILGRGTAERQASGALSLAGNFAFGSGGDTDASHGGVRSVGVFSAGSGTVTGGTLDSVQDNTSILNEAFTGTYTQGSNGRVTMTLVPTGGAAIMIPEIVWMVSNSRAYFLVDSTTKVEDGSIDIQTQNTFTNTDFKSKFGYAMVMDGYLSTSGYLTRVGTLYPDGNGNTNLNEETNSLPFPPGSLPGIINDPPTLPGTYQVRTDGRVTGTINSLSSNLIGYLVSPGQAYILQNDPGVEISGQLTLQTSP
jgi:hypothetical protein